MAKESDSWSSDPRPGRARPRSRGLWGWVAFLLVLGAASAFVWYVYLPLHQRRAELDLQASQRVAQAARSSQRLHDAELELGELKRKQGELSGELDRAVAEKERIEGELRRVQGELSAKLEPEIQAGNVLIKRRGNDLVVDLADDILFESGKAELHEAGQKVLGQVAPTLAQLAGYSVQVAGHTDSTRVINKATLERFPTNWELSTARATTVVRFLAEQGKVPGERLVASGFAQYRPLGANNTAAARQKNRRIELILRHD